MRAAGGSHPAWAPDGTLLYHCGGVCRTGIARDGGRLVVGAEERLFDMNLYPANARWFDAGPDGRVLMTVFDVDSLREMCAGTTSIRVIVNFFELLNERVPLDR